MTDAQPDTTKALPYIQRMLDRIADRDPLKVMQSTGDSLRAAIAGIDPATLHRPEGVGKWSIAQVVQHLADCEWVLGFRFRKVAAETDVTLPFFNQDAWATELQFTPINVPQALDDFIALRTINLRFTRALPADRRARTGFHPERGNESIQHMLRLYAGHDLAHLAQIDRIKSTV